MQGRVVAITGANRGIGAAAARVFAEAGAQVALLARDQASTARLAAELPGTAIALACDVTDAGQVQAAIDAVVARFGRLDVLINNAGVIEPIARIDSIAPEDWARTMQINLNGVFHGMRAALPVMKAQRSGTIITISSGAAHRPLEGWAAYCASKAGAAMLTEAAHLEEGATLRIMGLSPGTVATDMQVRIKASGVNAVSALDPSAHIPADWAARTLLWMCGPAGDGLRGQEVSLRDENIRRQVGLIA